MSDFVWAYENEDDDACVSVEDFPDRNVAGQGLADQSGLVYVFEGRGQTSVQDCECADPTKAVCPDSEDGSPCVVHERLDGWHFTSFETGPYGESDLRADLGDEYDEANIYRPVAPPTAEQRALAASPGLFDGRERS